MTYTVEDHNKVKKLAEDLILTCEPMKFSDELSGLSVSQCEALDSLAFECQTCNQWYDVADRIEDEDEFICKDCLGGGEA